MEPKKVLGVLAGRDLAPGALEAWLAWADLVVAADGGADLCREAGREPNKIVGDLDSISDPSGLTPDKDQDSSDADKLLAYVQALGIHKVTLIGVEGDRLDHVLATLYSCARVDLQCRLVLRTGVGHVHRGPKVIHGMGMNRRLSLMPLGRCRVTAKGFRWNLEDAWLDPLGLVSLSNVAVDPTYELRIHEGALAVITNATIDPCFTDPLDVGVLVAYLVGVLALGFSARLRDNSILQYLTAGRSLSLPAFVATLVATWYGGVLGSGDMVKYYGVGALLLNGVPYYLFAILYALWWAPRVRAADQISIPERLHLRYGKAAALVGAALVFLLAAPAAHTLMLGTLLQLATGLNLPLAVCVAALVAALFLFRGGLLADVRASLLAFVMMYVGFVVLVLGCLARQPLAELWTALPSTSKSPVGGQGLLSVATFFALGAWTLIDPGFHQRAASAATPETGRRGVLVSVLFWMLFDLLTTLAGLYAMIRLPQKQGLTLFPLLGDAVLAPGLKGVFLCGLFGTILAATVGYTLVAGATFGREFLARLNPTIDDQRTKTWTRVGFLVSGLLATALALSVKNVAVDLWYAYAGAVTGALLPPLALAYGRDRKIPGTAAAWGMALGFLAAVAWIVQAKRTNNDFLLVKFLGEEFSLGTLVPAAVVSCLVLILGTSFAKRETTR